MKPRNDRRPPSHHGKFVSKKTEDSEMWAKSVEKPKEPEVPLAVEPLLVSEKRAAQMLGISPRKTWALEKQGELKVRWVGRRKLYLVSSLKAFAESGSGVL